MASGTYLMKAVIDGIQSTDKLQVNKCFMFLLSIVGVSKVYQIVNSMYKINVQAEQGLLTCTLSK